MPSTICEVCGRPLDGDVTVSWPPRMFPAPATGPVEMVDAGEGWGGLTNADPVTGEAEIARTEGL